MATPALARQARELIRSAERAALSTLLVGAESWPYSSLVLAACTPNGEPVLLISKLAEHTKNILADGRVALLYDGTAGTEDPLAGARLTVLGRAAADPDPKFRARFLARHSHAGRYADFADFGIYRVAVDRAHLVAGFGQVRWIEGRELLLGEDSISRLAEAEADILAHMNADHGAALDLYANVLLGCPGTGWRMTGIDPDGIDLRRGADLVRMPFDRPILDAEGARSALAALARRASPAASEKR